jgi:hypothetical protein
LVEPYPLVKTLPHLVMGNGYLNVTVITNRLIGVNIIIFGYLNLSINQPNSKIYKGKYLLDIMYLIYLLDKVDTFLKRGNLVLLWETAI